MKKLTGLQKKIICLSASGGILEFYDFTIFIIFAKYISEVFFPGPQYDAIMKTYLVFVIGYMVRPIGGIILGHFADKFGRRNIFLISIFTMAVSTFYIGMIPQASFSHSTCAIMMIICRIIQGFSLGGEIPGAITYVYEHMPENRQSFGTAITYGSTLIGVVLGSLIGIIINFFFTEHDILMAAWRIPFLFGGVIGAIGWFIRYSLIETPTFVDILTEKNTLKIPFKNIILKYKKNFLLGCLLIFCTGSIFNVAFLVLPNFLNINFKYSLDFTFKLNLFGTLVMFLSTVLFGWLLDKLKHRIYLYYLFGNIVLIVLAYCFFKTIPSKNIVVLLVFYGFMSLAIGISNSAVAITLAKLFESNSRFSGIAFAYNIAFAISGGLSPILVTWFNNYFNVNSALFYYITGAAALCAILSFFTMGISKICYEE